MHPIRTGTLADVEGLTTVVASAFAADPLMVWLLPDPVTRAVATEAWWTPLVAGYLHAGRALVAEGAAACLLWRRSDEQIPDAPGQPPMRDVIARLVAPERRPEVGAGLAVFPRLRPAREHVYVHVVAVHPRHQGHGLGARLLAELASLDTGRDLVCLESTNPMNHPFYERNGFRAGAAAPLAGSPVTVTAFARRAGGPGGVTASGRPLA